MTEQESGGCYTSRKDLYRRICAFAFSQYYVRVSLKAIINCYPSPSEWRVKEGSDGVKESFPLVALVCFVHDAELSLMAFVTHPSSEVM